MSDDTCSPDCTHDTPSFVSLLAIHGRLDEVFGAHQEALLLRAFERAQERLAAFEREIAAHMRFEEDVLFPIYERAGPIAGGGVGLFLNEHAKLRRFVARMAEALRDLGPDEPGASKRVIALFDYEARFKNLMTHHDLRERNILYPTLDRVASARESRELLGAAGATQSSTGGPGSRPADHDLHYNR